MEENLSIARELVYRYREFVQSKHLDGILGVLCDDASIRTPNLPALVGKSAIGSFYADCFASGSYDFELDIEDEKIQSDIVFINGTIRQSKADSGQDDASAFRHFSFIMKKESGEMKVWQIRIA